MQTLHFMEPILYNFLKIKDVEELNFIKQGFFGINVRLHDKFNLKIDQIGHETETVTEILREYQEAKQAFEIENK